MEKTLGEDMEDFMGYLKQCTNAQVRGVYEKEKKANRIHFAVLARAEAEKRRIELEQ